MRAPAKFCFGGDLILPITPESFEVGHGIKIETVNIHAVGDLRIAGYTTLDSITISGIFPANRYSFAATDDTDPYALVARFKAWSDGRKPVRFLITGTDVNIPVLIESIRYGEKDGSGDVYYTLNLAEYRYASASAGSSRAVDAYPRTQQEYTVQKGETLRVVAERFYGDPWKAEQLKRVNRMENASLRLIGRVIKVPEVMPE